MPIAGQEWGIPDDELSPIIHQLYNIEERMFDLIETEEDEDENEL